MSSNRVIADHFVETGQWLVRVELRPLDIRNRPTYHQGAETGQTAILAIGFNHHRIAREAPEFIHGDV